MESRRALFVPGNLYAAYDCAVEIVEYTGSSNQKFLTVHLIAQPCGRFVNLDGFISLLDIDAKRNRPFPAWVGKVKIQVSDVPEYSLELTNEHKVVLNFEETVSFFSKISGFKRA